MTNTSGSVLCCCRDYLFLPTIALFYCRTTIFEDFDRSDRWDSTAIYIVYFFKPDSVGFEAGRHAEGPVFLQACCVNITLYYIAAHQHA